MAKLTLSEIYNADPNFGSEDWDIIADYAIRRVILDYVGPYEIWASDRDISRGAELYAVEEDEDIIVSYLGVTSTGNPKLLQTTTVITNPKMRGRGAAYILYTWLLGEGYSLMSDDSQTAGGKAIWAKLFRDGYPMIDNSTGEPVKDIMSYYSVQHKDVLIVQPKS